MLDIETKRRIDEARDILVGKIPDPKSQVEQITIALIYKFMNDIDAESEELGGERTFFAGEFDKYRWANLVHSGLGGYEMLNLYTEALVRIPENPNIPPLFREIFNNVYLPYRDPETLRMFFNVIDDFTYDNSERLGDAFEHLLSVLGSQGDAGQFRTPRHIIDFMVKIIDPQKDERVMDPACGTAGFLVSSYKHIRDASSDDLGRTTLTPDEHAQLVTNLAGYDISPDMVRLSLVNMYLHGFPQPNIHEYDTLTSEERWGEYSNVILANPPFMSPKGGIRPHNRFSVQSSRSEVLFVDYIAEHLTPDGRAAVIVPEGIIFQSQNAHTQLRKMLVEEYLVAVVSLPPGVFNPYSGVKTSILVMDKSLARRTNRIAFFRVAHDGYGLGAQRRPVTENDLPTALEDINEYLRRTRADETLDDFCPTTGLIVGKERIAEDGEYSLSGGRYVSDQTRTSHFPLVDFEKICTLEYGASLPKKKRRDGPYPVMGSNGISGYHDDYLIQGPAIVVGRKGSAGEVTYVPDNCFPIDTTYYVNLADKEETDLLYIYYLLKTLGLPELRNGAGVPGLNRNDVYNKYRLPLPPLEVQREIVAEIEGYQRVIDGARAVIENYRPHIAIDPEWSEFTIGECCDVRGGKRLPKGERLFDTPTNHPYIRVSDFWRQSVDQTDMKFISDEIHGQISRYTISSEDVYISIAGTIGLMGVIPDELSGANLTENAAKISFDEDVIDKHFLATMGSSDFVQDQIRALTHAVGVPKLALYRIKELRLPIPSLEAQRAIVSEIEVERAIVDANRELVKRMEARIEAAIGRVWETDTRA